MAKVTFSPRAYCKIVLHAAKYPHCAINGLLLAKSKSKTESESSDVYVADAIPLFHLCLHVSPMAEIALTLVDQYAMQQGYTIVGYYFANELLNDMSTDKPAHRMADKIAENFHNALLAVIDNEQVTAGSSERMPFRVSQHIDGKWKIKDKDDILLEHGDAVREALCTLLECEEYRTLVDFDNHLDNVSLNWRNIELNKTIKNFMAYEQ